MSDQKYEIAVLAEDYHHKQQAFEYYALRNAAGLSAEQRLELSIQYHQAEADMLKAGAALTKAKVRYAASE